MLLERRTILDLPVERCGVYVRSRCFAFAITTTGLAATLAFGGYDEQEGERLCTVWVRTLAGPRRDTLVDATAVHRVDASAFVKVRDLLESRRDERARVVRRQAIVSRSDLGSAVVRGYFAMFPPPYPIETFERRGDALAWLGHRECAQEIEEVEGAGAELMVRLREWLEQGGAVEGSVERAARALGVTPRTLQRRLSAEGTCYSDELARARVARAQRLMREPERKLSDIALEVGCATPSAFSDLFRKVTGASPSEWKRRWSAGSAAPAAPTESPTRSRTPA